MDYEDLKKRFAAYVAHRLPDARDIHVENVNRIHGGASRETYRMDLGYRLGDKRFFRGVILRLVVEESLLETEASIEFRAYEAFYSTDIPVPEALWCEEDASHLGKPFMLLEEIQGCESSIEALVQPPYSPVREKIGVAFCEIMGRIAAIDPATTSLSGTMPTPEPDQCWQRELDYWENVVEEDALEPQPVTRAAIRWLRRNPPSPAQKLSVVHGDCRIGNVLYDSAGKIHAVLDWEQCHFGDPLEDLGYALNPLWSIPEPHKLGLMITRDEAIALWERTSRLKAPPEDLHWWSLFAMVKGMGIWLSASREFADGRNMDPMMAYAGWSAGDIQSQLIVTAMGRA